MQRSLELNPRDLRSMELHGLFSRACLDSLQYDEALLGNDSVTPADPISPKHTSGLRSPGAP